MPDFENIQPKLSDSIPQIGVGDSTGSLAYSGIADSATAGEVAFQGPTADFINNGVVNGVFAQPPTDTAANIEIVNNPLGYWTGPTQVAGGMITCSYVADASSPSGYNLRFTIQPNGAASDEAYVEQIINIGGSRDRAYAHGLRTSIMNTGAVNMNATTELQYLTVAGVATGSANAISNAITAGATTRRQQSPLAPPADAYYLRVRIGAARGAAAVSATTTIEYPSIRIEKQSGRIWIPEESSPASHNPAPLLQDQGIVQVYGDNGFWVAEGPLILTEQTAPGTPDSGSYYIYPKSSDSLLYGKNDAGTEVALGGGGLSTTTVISPAQLLAAANDYAPAGGASAFMWRITSDASRAINGISISQTQGTTILIVNANTTAARLINLQHEQAGSTAANRLDLPNDATIAIDPGGSVQLIYDAVISRWIAISEP